MAGIDAYTKLMLHMNGSDGSTTFTDSSDSAHTVTAVDDAQIDTEQYKFGEASGLFDGTGDYVYIEDTDDVNFGSGALTIDFQFRSASNDSTHGLFGQYVDSSHYLYAQWNTATGRLYFAARNGAGYDAQFYMTTGEVPSIGTWYHVAFVISSGTPYIFIDGDSKGLTVDDSPGTLADLSGNFTIGWGEAYNLYTNGWLDEFRISKGIARWTSNFTPPTSEYDDVTYTDIGLRIRGSSTITIGAEELTASHKLRIHKGGTTYGLPLVDTGNADASPLRIYDGSSVKALVQIT